MNPEETQRHSLPRLLYWLTLLAAAGLMLLVWLAPSLPTSVRLLELFATDAVVRQTALASAIGLTVTALVFFKQPSVARPTPRKTPAVVLPPRPPVIGA